MGFVLADDTAPDEDLRDVSSGPQTRNVNQGREQEIEFYDSRDLTRPRRIQPIKNEMTSMI
jgi:hypothetical protein